MIAACGGKKPPPAIAPSAPEPRAAAAPEKPEPQKALAYEASASPGDVVSACVKPERSSRLGIAMPKGKAREAWSAALDATLEPAFLLTTGTRVVVVGRSARYAMFDTKGMSIATGELGGKGERVHIDSAGGVLSGTGGKSVSLADGAEADVMPSERGAEGDGKPLSQAATHGDATIYVNGNSLEVKDPSGVRQIIQGAFDVIGLAVDDDGVAFGMVRQKGVLSLWITPLRGGSIGRVKLPAGKREKTSIPPILGKAVRVIVYDDRLVGVAAEGKTLWEKRKLPTGGATMTLDDRLLVATDEAVQVIDPANGKAAEVANAKGEVFVTPPILAQGGILLAASAGKLHAFAFE
jgi:hypothetical protein